MQFTITYIRTLTLEETIEAATVQEAEEYAQARAWDSCELLNGDFAESETEFSVDEVGVESETSDRPVTQQDHEAVAERRFLEAGMTERYDCLPWRQQEEA